MENRLIPTDKINFQRAQETFMVEDSSCPDEINLFLENIVENMNIENLNFIRSWAELGIRPTQCILNQMLYSAFYIPSLVSEITIISKLIGDELWIFHALCFMTSEHNDLLKGSIEKDSIVWSFILDQLDTDFYLKSNILEIPYDERPYAFLCEALILYWPCDKNFGVKISELVVIVVEFLLTVESNTSHILLSTFTAVFPEIVVPLVQDKLHILQANCLNFLLQQGYLDNIHIKYKKDIIATKLLPFNKEYAESLMKDENASESSAFYVVSSYFNQKTSHFVIDS